MKKIILTLVVIVLLAVSVRTTIKAFPREWNEQQIREYMTKERILSSMTGRDGNIHIKLEYSDRLTITKDDWDNIEVTINYLNKTTYSIYGDCFNYNVTLDINNIKHKGKVIDIIITGNVITDYRGGNRNGHLIDNAHGSTDNFKYEIIQ